MGLTYGKSVCEESAQASPRVESRGEFGVSDSLRRSLSRRLAAGLRLTGIVCNAVSVIVRTISFRNALYGCGLAIEG
ncbi:MAG: hypothetical protein HW412_2495 [Bacteroidetes bacterium]|nr:hypothetical protein [Bacteroidota bacterium]